MFKITLDKIYLTKGDTARFSIGIDNSSPGNDYILSNEDLVYFIVTENPEVVDIEDLGVDPTKYVFYKQGVDILINSEDTKDLEKDIYYYQVRVILGQSGDINTLIEPEEFCVTPISKVI